MRLQISLPRDAAVKMVSVAIDVARAENMLPLTVVVLDAAGKIRQDPIVGFLHARAKNVERSYDIGMGTLVRVEDVAKGLSHPLALVVTGTRALASNIPPVTLSHRNMLWIRIAIYFT